MRTRLSAAVTTLLAAAIALAQPAGSPPAQAQPAADPLPHAKVTLTSPGAEPRQTLRFKPVVGARESVEMVMKMSQEGTNNGMAMPRQQLPAITMPMVIDVTAVSADGWISYTSTFGKPLAASDDPDPRTKTMVDQINTVLAGMQNAKAIVVVSDRGVVRDASMQLAGEANPLLDQMVAPLKQSMKQLCVPMPEEAIGVGGTWTVEFQSDLQGVRSTQVATYTLREFTPAGCTLGVTVDQTGAKQDVKNPSLPPGVTLTLESLSGSGSGASTLAFDRVMPTSATMNSSITTQMTVNQGGQPMNMTQKVQIDMVLRDTQAAPAQPGEAPQ